MLSFSFLSTFFCSLHPPFVNLGLALHFCMDSLFLYMVHKHDKEDRNEGVELNTLKKQYMSGTETPAHCTFYFLLLAYL